MKENMKTYTIMGATGNIGKALTLNLLESGHSVRAITRSADKAETLASKGAEIMVGAVDDATFLAGAFKNADAIFAMIPPNYAAPDFRAFQNTVGAAITEAIKQSGVTHVVSLSSIGAHLSEKVGPIKGLHDQEQRLDALAGVNILHLRPTYFMENLFAVIDVVKNQKIVGSGMRSDHAQSMIATADIAAYAARRLQALDFQGKSSRELLGARDVTWNEITIALKELLKRDDLNYVQFSYEDTYNTLLPLGFSPSAANELVELDRAINDGDLTGTEIRSPENTTPTRIEDFLPVLAAACA